MGIGHKSQSGTTGSHLPAWLLPTPPRPDEAGRTATVGNFALREMSLRLMRGENLTRTEAAHFVGALLTDSSTDAQIAAALAALAIKGETAEELAGMAEAMRDRAVQLECRHEKFIDTAGTGSSAVKTFNVSTAAALVIAGAGLPVAKHGSRAATSRSGSADVLEALGVNTTASPDVVEHCLNQHGICFMFAPLYHGATARVAHVRRELGLHTTFNLLGPLTNPARAPYQILGVWHESLMEPVARALRLLGARNAWVVHGTDGLDEITLAAKTLIAESRQAEAASSNATGEVGISAVQPEDFGLRQRQVDQLRGGGPRENAELIRHIFTKDDSEILSTARDLVIINAAAALHVAGVAATLLEGAELARDSITGGRAVAKLDALVRETNLSR
jgi:anthranilate phosphoribosyltransferase